MAKTKTSTKREKFSFADMPIVKVDPKNAKPYNPKVRLLNKELVTKALMQCIVDNDMLSFFEIYEAHILAVKSLSDALRSVKLPRSTYNTAKAKRNPRVDTVSKILKSLAA